MSIGKPSSAPMHLSFAPGAWARKENVMTYYLVAGCGCGGCNLIAIDKNGNIVSIYLPLSAVAK